MWPESVKVVIVTISGRATDAIPNKGQMTTKVVLTRKFYARHMNALEPLTLRLIRKSVCI